MYAARQCKIAMRFHERMAKDHEKDMAALRKLGQHDGAEKCQVLAARHWAKYQTWQEKFIDAIESEGVA